MKFGFLSTSPTKEQVSKNLGDYVQSIAAAQYYPHIDTTVHREHISDCHLYNDGEIKVIMNSWWMWQSQNWPPSKSIIPLPVSMHISSICADTLLSGDGLEWFKKNEPIGCRDMHTLRLLESKGVRAYYSGCLTLTLNKTYNPVPDNQRDGICFVDPYVHLEKNVLRYIPLMLQIFKAPRTILKLYNKQFFRIAGYNTAIEWTNPLKILAKVLSFYKTYSSAFTDKVLCEAEYLSNMFDVSKIKDDESLIAKTKSLLKQYSTKKMIITSRIHVALPSLSMETPVIFIKHPAIVGEGWNGGRLEGLIELFRCMEQTRNGLVSCDPLLATQLSGHAMGGGKIDLDFTFTNKDTWRIYANDLDKKCTEFCNE